MSHPLHHGRRALVSLVVAALLLTIGAASVSAHVHTANGQIIANGQLHGSFSADGVTCGGDPAAYGLKTAHHGPDSGTAGKADGCYQVDSMPPGTDDQNPAIN